MAKPAGKGADMMGTKSDMISSKIDEVSRNSIWREHVRHENKLCKLNESFSVNPRTIATITGKPNVRERCVDKEAEEKELEEFRKTLSSSKTIKDQCPYPMSASQEIGWWHDEMKQDTKWTKARKTCTETNYAMHYVAMTGRSPFAAKK